VNKSNKIKSNLAVFNILGIVRKINTKERFFFFPFYHVGGAERVHVDILESFEKEGNLCFITNTSKNESFKNLFKSFSNLIYLGKLVKRPFKKWTFKIISKAINKNKNAVVFGCNTGFFYELIPFLEPHVLVIDLIHAFADGGIEVESLPYVDRIDKRVVLGKKTLNDFKELYKNNGIHSSSLEKINIIRNQVDTNVSEKYFKNDDFTILFVGRNSKEKRFYLFLEIAKRMMKSKKVKFIVIGPFDRSMYSEYTNVSFKGEINDKKVLNKYYSKSHLLLITSSREGMPMVILEGMVYGVVPISTDVGEISSVISEDKSNGCLVLGNNENDIIDSFIFKIKMLKSDREKLELFSKNVRSCVSENFSKEVFEKSYTNLFKK